MISVVDSSEMINDLTELVNTCEVNWAELLMEPWEIHVSWRENSELYLHLNYQNGLDGKFMLLGSVKQKCPLSVSVSVSSSKDNF